MATTLPSYITVADANIYFGNRLHVTAWLGATAAEKDVALVEATQRIDRLRFSGYLVDDDQALEFPRYYDEIEGADGTEVVPDEIGYATCEVALALLDGVDPDIEYENLATTNHGYGSAKLSRTQHDTVPHLAAGIPSATAWRYLKQYLASGRNVRIRRVS